MKLYDSIYNCPIFIFDTVIRSKDYALVGGVDEWNKLYAEYVDVFGVSDQFKAYLQAKCEECVNEIEAVVNNSSLHKTLSELSRIEAEAIQEKSSLESPDLYTLSAILSKKMGFRVDPKKVTVAEFYNYLKCK